MNPGDYCVTASSSLELGSPITCRFAEPNCPAALASHHCFLMVDLHCLNLPELAYLFSAFCTCGRALGQQWRTQRREYACNNNQI